MKATSFLLFFTVVACGSVGNENAHPVKDPLARKVEKASQCYHESDTFRDRKPLHLELVFGIENNKLVDPKIKSMTVKDPNFETCFLTIMKETTFPDEKNNHVDQNLVVDYVPKVKKK